MTQNENEWVERWYFITIWSLLLKICDYLVAFSFTHSHTCPCTNLDNVLCARTPFRDVNANETMRNNIRGLVLACARCAVLSNYKQIHIYYTSTHVYACLIPKISIFTRKVSIFHCEEEWILMTQQNCLAQFSFLLLLLQLLLFCFVWTSCVM